MIYPSYPTFILSTVLQENTNLVEEVQSLTSKLLRNEERLVNADEV